jgi:hypothetical protein
MDFVCRDRLVTMQRDRGRPSDIAEGLVRQARIIGGVLVVIGVACLGAAAWMLLASPIISMRMLLCFGLIGMSSLAYGIRKLTRGHDHSDEWD